MSTDAVNKFNFADECLILITLYIPPPGLIKSHLNQ